MSDSVSDSRYSLPFYHQTCHHICSTSVQRSAWDVRRHPQLPRIALRDMRAYDSPRGRHFKKPTCYLLVSDIFCAPLLLQRGRARVVAQTDSAARRQVFVHLGPLPAPRAVRRGRWQIRNGPDAALCVPGLSQYHGKRAFL